MAENETAIDGQEETNPTGAAKLAGELALYEGAETVVEAHNEGNGAWITLELEHPQEDMGTELELTYRIDEAEELVVAIRDEIVRAKRGKLEWETNTDPETGIKGEIPSKSD